MKTALIGAGTILFQDEGVGIYACQYLEQNYNFDEDITIIDGGVLGFGLMEYYQEYDKVLILDTITMKNDKPGAVYNLPSEELMGLGSYKQTAHEVEIVEMLEMCSLLENRAEVNIIGMVPQDIQKVEVGLTKTMKDNFFLFVDTALKQLSKMGIKYSKKEKEVTLETIIDKYTNPTARRNL